MNKNTTREFESLSDDESLESRMSITFAFVSKWLIYVSASSLDGYSKFYNIEYALVLQFRKTIVNRSKVSVASLVVHNSVSGRALY